MSYHDFATGCDFVIIIYSNMFEKHEAAIVLHDSSQFFPGVGVVSGIILVF